MGRRGRPRHPDILTPREWKVLELLRQRLSNEQIAERLGITLDGAKYHVSQILAKLGVAAREEAASLSLEERRLWWASWPLWAKIAGAATVAAAAAGLALLGWAVIATKGSREPGSAETLASFAANSLAPTTVPLSAGPFPTTLASLPDVDFTAGEFNASFPDDAHGWLATGKKIFVTVDGGSTWSEQSDNQVGLLDFVSASVGWAASGTALLTTRDGGLSWREVSRDLAPPRDPKTPAGITKLAFVDEIHGWAQVSLMTIVRTEDGGVTWEPVNDPCNHPLGKFPSGPFAFIDANTGWIICSEASMAGVWQTKLLNTNDGGRTWQPLTDLSNTLGGQALSQDDLFFKDAANGWLSGSRNGLFATSDGGHTWRQIAAWKDPGKPGSTRNLTYFRVFPSGKVYALTIRDLRYALFKTDNGGATWLRLYPFILVSSLRACTADDLNAIWVGSNGLTGGQMVGGVALSNKSDTACQLKGIPVVQLLDAQGGVIPTQASDMCFPNSCAFIQPAILTPGSGEPQPHFPKPGQASFGIQWGLHNGAGTCEPPPSTAVSLQLTLPSGGGDISLSIDPVSRLSPCQGTIAVSPFTATEN